MAENSLLQLSGTVENVVYHNDRNQYTVLEMSSGDELVTVVGSFPYVSVGEELEVYGAWTNHATFGQQFKSDAFERSRPATTSAMLKYLSSGAVKGIGPALANKIVVQFGDRSLEVIENEPERLSQIKGITKEKAREISNELQRIYGMRELMAFLGAYGVRPEQTVSVWKKYGQESINCIQSDPYSICEDDLEISFHIADSIAESMEKQINSMDRLKAGVKYVLKHNLNNGHTCLPKDRVIPAASKLLGVTEDEIKDAIYIACENYEIFADEFGDREFLFLPAQYQSERYIADRMKLMLKYPPQKIAGADKYIEIIENEKGIQYADKQKEAIKAALEKGILILTGGPGTGKTTTLNAIIRILKEKGEEVLLAAPTGRAAKRMSELTGEEAKTIHRMLKVDWDEHDRPVFTKNEHDPLDCDCIIIDELSMVDSYVFDSVLKALPMSCRMIFVGDTDQLPSVGAGNVLGDLINSGFFTTVQLKEIFRQSLTSLIVTNAHKIVQGEIPELTRKDSDFFFMPCYEKDKAANLIVSLCAQRLPNSYGYSSVTDIQVLCPGRKGELGTYELNKGLRNAINPQEKGKQEIKINGNVFRLGDKVMQIRNNYNLPWVKADDTSGEGVFNGDMGIVADIDKAAGNIQVLIDDKYVSYTFEIAAQELELAYAVTVHKSQGNEFTAVIIPVLDTVPMLCYRNLFYTGITRAKKLLILVGEKETIVRMIRNNKRTKRYTGLLKFLKYEEEI